MTAKKKSTATLTEKCIARLNAISPFGSHKDALVLDLTQAFDTRLKALPDSTEKELIEWILSGSAMEQQQNPPLLLAQMTCDYLYWAAVQEYGKETVDHRASPCRCLMYMEQLSMVDCGLWKDQDVDTIRDELIGILRELISEHPDWDVFDIQEALVGKWFCGKMKASKHTREYLKGFVMTCAMRCFHLERDLEDLVDTHIPRMKEA